MSMNLYFTIVFITFSSPRCVCFLSKLGNFKSELGFFLRLYRSFIDLINAKIYWIANRFSEIWISYFLKIKRPWNDRETFVLLDGLELWILGVKWRRWGWKFFTFRVRVTGAVSGITGGFSSMYMCVPVWRSDAQGWTNVIERKKHASSSVRMWRIWRRRCFEIKCSSFEFRGRKSLLDVSSV